MDIVDLGSEKLTVACVYRTGRVYSAEYVKRLKDCVDKHLNGHNFVCLSDVDVPCERIPLSRSWGGWWSKIELFRLKGKVLYFDLDTVIKGDLAEIAEYPHQFTMLTDFYFPELLASGVMAWDGDYSHIYREFDIDADHPGRGDQGYIATKVKPERFQDLFPEQFVSRKRPKKRNDNERVVCFHGDPRPHTVGWEV